MALTDNLLAFYKLNDLTDSSGNGNTLTNNGDVTFSSGKIGNAADFDGNSSLSLNALPNSGATSSTISMWFKDTSGESERFLIAGGYAESEFFIIRSGSDVKGGFKQSGEIYAGGSVADDGNWHFATIRYTPTEFKIWLDGVSNNTNGVYSSIDSSEYFQIGANSVGNYLRLNGQIDAVGIWNRALSDAEVTELYNSGTGLELDGAAPASSSMVKLIDGVKLFGKTKFVS